MTDRRKLRLEQRRRKQKWNRGLDAKDIRLRRQKQQILTWWWAQDRQAVLEWLRSPLQTIPKPIQHEYRARVGAFSQEAV